MNSRFSSSTIIVYLLFTLLACLFAPISALPEASPQRIRVALYHDKGARPRDILATALETAPDIAFTAINGEMLREGYLSDFDLLIVPGGSAKKESMSMEAEGRKEVRRFVGEGGLYIGICAGCYLLTEARPSDLGLMPLDTRDKAHWARGKGRLEVELTPLGQEIFGTNQRMFSILYHNGPVIDASHVTPASEFSPLGFFRQELVKRGNTRGLMINQPAMFLGRFGKGLVLGISPHPEADKSQVFMEINAIRWLYAHRTPK